MSGGQDLIAAREGDVATYAVDGEDNNGYVVGKGR